MGGAIIILFVMFVAGPIGVFAVGVIWSALTGWLLTPTPTPTTPAADRRRDRSSGERAAASYPQSRHPGAADQRVWPKR